MIQHKAKAPIPVYIGPTKRTFEVGEIIDLSPEVIKANFKPEWTEKVSSESESGPSVKIPKAPKKNKNPELDSLKV